MFALAVAGLAEARAVAARLGATHALSILDPDGTQPPELGLPADRHIVLRVNDIEDAGVPGCRGPDEAFVSAVLTFARSLPIGARVLVHCHAGISRSPAAALTIMGVLGRAPELPGLLAMPNMRILEIAERMTGLPLTAAGEAVRARTDLELAHHDWPSPADRP